jgi:hypothetical protein
MRRTRRQPVGEAASPSKTWVDVQLLPFGTPVTEVPALPISVTSVVVAAATGEASESGGEWRDCLGWEVSTRLQLADPGI